MTHIRNVSSASLGLAWRCAVMLVGVAILLGISSGRKSDPRQDEREPGPGGDTVRDEDGIQRVTLVVPEGETTARCVLRDRDGIELMCVYYGIGGLLYFNMPESSHEIASGSRARNGS